MSISSEEQRQILQKVSFALCGVGDGIPLDPGYAKELADDLVSIRAQLPPTERIKLLGGQRAGMVIDDIPEGHESIEVAYIVGSTAIRLNPEDRTPEIEIRYQIYRRTFEYDDGIVVFRP